MEIEVTKNNIEELLSSELPLMIDFWAEWCGPCRMISPVVEELAAEYNGKINIGKCNVDEEAEVTEHFKIRNIPTLLFFKGGEMVDKHVGAATKAQLADKLNALL
ncbi:MAG: thioredoxin [Rikenellaceae bacterium]|nr:thioredoxin [Rikenellaceae bacterium]MBR2443611.1 thioredoxin [Rikenellaceae bacterium]